MMDSARAGGAVCCGAVDPELAGGLTHGFKLRQGTCLRFSRPGGRVSHWRPNLSSVRPH